MLQRSLQEQRIFELEAQVGESKTEATTLWEERRVLQDEVKELGDMIDQY